MANEEIPELRGPTELLLDALGYKGIAEVEYLQDQRTGGWKLIEINPRHWDWHQIEVGSGVNLSWIACCHLSGKPLPAQDGTHRPTKWINEEYLLFHLLERLLHGDPGPRSLLRKIAGRRMYGLFSWRYPFPFLHCILFEIPPRLFRASWRRVTGRKSSTPPGRLGLRR